VGGLLFAAMSLQLTSDLGFKDALTRRSSDVSSGPLRSDGCLVITACMFLVRVAALEQGVEVFGALVFKPCTMGQVQNVLRS